MHLTGSPTISVALYGSMSAHSAHTPRRRVNLHIVNKCTALNGVARTGSRPAAVATQHLTAVPSDVEPFTQRDWDNFVVSGKDKVATSVWPSSVMLAS